MKFISLFTAIVAIGYTAIGFAAIPQTVQTSSGTVQGQIASDTSGVSEYLGIPFANPPVGQLRWAPPEPFNGSSTINATEFGYSCPANTNFTSTTSLDLTDLNVTAQGVEILISILGQVEVTYSEDCLTLNVWTKPQTGEKKKAVLFWIYGGGYNTGTTNNTAYNGKYIADQEDVVVVTANYRLNIFGFPGDPNIRNNLGLLDQRLAVEWVHDNIAAFGGDPDRITIFGQSAGGSSVDYYSYAWTSDPIVAGFIAESGNVFSPDSQADPIVSAEAWYSVTSTLSCGDANSDPTSVLSCMRSKDWQAIENAIPTSTGIASVTAGFGPTIDNITVFSDYLAPSTAGELIKRPLLIGNNDNEASMFRVLFGLQGVTYSDAEWDLLALVLFTCSTGYRALVSVENQIPTWRYRWFGNFANLKLTTVPDSGAWHGSEIPIIFGTDMDIQNLVARTPAESQIAAYTRGAWAAFAKDPVNGLTNYGFPRYGPLNATLLQLAYDNKTGPNVAFPAEYDSGCANASALLDTLVGTGTL